MSLAGEIKVYIITAAIAYLELYECKRSEYLALLRSYVFAFNVCFPLGFRVRLHNPEKIQPAV